MKRTKQPEWLPVHRMTLASKIFATMIAECQGGVQPVARGLGYPPLAIHDVPDVWIIERTRNDVQHLVDGAYAIADLFFKGPSK